MESREKSESLFLNKFLSLSLTEPQFLSLFTEYRVKMKPEFRYATFSSWSRLTVPFASVLREYTYKIHYDLLHLILHFLIMLLLVFPLPFLFLFQCKMHQRTLSFDSSHVLFPSSVPSSLDTLQWGIVHYPTPLHTMCKHCNSLPYTFQT